METVCVLMSTYNGSTFLTEQLDSITNQTDVKVKLIIRDDGSKDNGQTINLINDYIKKHPKVDITLIKGDNKGWALSFMDLVYLAPDCEYYAFSDQDDIWLPEKLKKAVDSLNSIHNQVKLYCSNLFYYTVGKEPYLIEKPHLDSVSLEKALMRNINTGCTCVFSKGLKDIVSKHRNANIMAHDYWLFITAIIFGKVVYDNNSYIYYRQHEGNQIGAKVSLIDKTKRRLKEITSGSKTHKRELLSKQLLTTYSSILDDDIRRKIEPVANYRSSIKYRAILLSSYKYIMEKPINTLYLKIRILIGNL